MVERLLCKQEVIGSIPFTSTIQVSVDSVSRQVEPKRTIGAVLSFRDR